MVGHQGGRGRGEEGGVRGGGGEAISTQRSCVSQPHFPQMNPEKAFTFRYNKSTVCQKDIKTIISLDRRVGTIFRIGEDGWYHTPTETQRWIGVFDPESDADYIWDKVSNSVWWSVGEVGVFGECELSRWSDSGSKVWKRTDCKQLEVRPPPAPPETKQKKNTVKGNDLLGYELYRWGHVPNNLCSMCFNKYREHCPYKRACKHLHLVGNYGWPHIWREGLRMKKAGLQSYEWLYLGSSVGSTAAPPVAASSGLPDLRWEIDMNKWVTFDEMKAYIQPAQQLLDWQVLQYWDTLPKQSDYSDQEAATSSLPDLR